MLYCRDAADDAMIDQILASTQHPLALDAFVSILFAPQARLSFDGMVEAMQCPVCMIYGREEPWVVPLWGQRLKRVLADAVYLEVRGVRSTVGQEAMPNIMSLFQCML